MVVHERESPHLVVVFHVTIYLVVVYKADEPHILWWSLTLPQRLKLDAEVTEKLVNVGGGRALNS